MMMEHVLKPLITHAQPMAGSPPGAPPPGARCNLGDAAPFCSKPDSRLNLSSHTGAIGGWSVGWVAGALRLLDDESRWGGLAVLASATLVGAAIGSAAMLAARAAYKK